MICIVSIITLVCVCIKFKSIIFNFLVFPFLYMRNIENWNIAVYVHSMYMHCYYNIDINPPCFIINFPMQICDQWLSLTIYLAHYRSVPGKCPRALKRKSWFWPACMDRIGFKLNALLSSCNRVQTTNKQCQMVPLLIAGHIVIKT